MRRGGDCRRPPLWQSREGVIPAWIYNQAALLLRRLPAPVYVPMRYVSVMGILYPAEWVFCDYVGGRVAVSVWHDFRPQHRSGLQEPVSCVMDLFSEKGEAILKRLPMEFYRSLTMALEKAEKGQKARGVVLSWERRDEERH